MDSLLFFFLFFYSLPAPAGADLAGDGKALLDFRSAVGRQVLTWSASVSPCTWKGVTCAAGRVASVHLPASSLIGQIPSGSLGSLSDLRVLSLRLNALSGPLPSDLGGCTRLRSLYLTGNLFSGEIPPFLPYMSALIRIDLADNNLSGEIPNSLNNLAHLAMLNLENNQLTGEVPDLHIPTLVKFNVSFNRLNGSVPVALRGMPATAFLGMPLCGEPLPPCTGEVSPSPSGSPLFVLRLRKIKARTKTSTDAKMVMGKKNSVTSPPPPSSEMLVRKKDLVFFGSGPTAFGLEDLLRAPAVVLGKDAFGTTYKADLGNGLKVTVMRLRDVSLPEEEFVKQVDALGAMRHHNIVFLLAYYHSREERLLVYDFMPLRSLFSLLHGSSVRPPPTWESRTSIALDVARCVEYIHSTSPNAFHGNIKSSTILITRSTEVRICGTGLARLVDTSPTSQRPFGYRAPEISKTWNVTQEADVYSFGVLLLELVTGKNPADLREEGIDLGSWVQAVIQGERSGELFDVELVRNGAPEVGMVRLLQLGMDCTSFNPNDRPAMATLAARIQEIRRRSAQKTGKAVAQAGI
ncbi:hypothetical protein HPP92_009415 [Vanilla planifolia]|uniref:Protein kinase domain-containing protein n=1 Tax=Vanilla planifolia TaxID=51239 RepID=A0A835RFT4_VANPL|nr:hypothetical protein HPP92_009415 [Vanilla planifolia]